MPSKICDLYCFAALANTIENKFNSDSVGNFPTCFRKGYQYILVSYVHNEDSIMVQGMTNREAYTQLKIPRYLQISC